MPVSPQEAKELFQEEIGPELRREGEFGLARDESRRLVYSDGVVPAEEPAPLLGAPRDWGVYAKLRRLMARRITVEFVSTGTGTRVSLRGSAERDVCAGLEKLGSPGHWPENRERVRESREREG